MTLDEIRIAQERASLVASVTLSAKALFELLELAAITRAAIDQSILTDADLTEIYDKANGHEFGKLKPITTAKIFCAMRACLSIAHLKESSGCGFLTATSRSQ